MQKNPFQNLWSLIVFLITFTLIFNGTVFGQMIVNELDGSAEAEIFPFSSGLTEEDIYSEDFYEITDEGYLDANGYHVERLPEENVADEPSAFIDTAMAAIADLKKDEEVIDSISAFESYKETIVTNWGGKRSFTEHRLDGIRESLENERRNFEYLGDEIVGIEDKFQPIHDEIETIKGQINLLNRQLIETKEKIQSAELMIVEKKLLIKDLMYEIRRSEAELEIQEEIVLEYIVLVYQEEEGLFDLFDESSSTFKLLLADNSVSENLLGHEYLQVLEKTGRDVFYNLHDRKIELHIKKEKLEHEQAVLSELYLSLNNERVILQQGRSTKKILLEETRGEEILYQQLLQESIQQRLESAIAIQNLQDNIQFIEQKLDILDDSLEKIEVISADPEKIEQFEALEAVVEEVNGGADEETEDGERIPKNQTFIWPIPPVAVTSYFRDPTYPKKWGEHSAVDLRAKHFTEIVAPANAYVFDSQDNGMGYSYIILAHKNNLMTVYGHVADSFVKPGTLVKQGDVIGLSGATPGTKGAGWQTTGPHLHFELYYKGEHVDPLDYLPVLELPIEFIPNKYLLAEFEQ